MDAARGVLRPGLVGHDRLAGTKVYLVGKRKKNLGRALKRWLKRRAAIEPIIGHLKAYHCMNRNHYRGQHGDAANALRVPPDST